MKAEAKGNPKSNSEESKENNGLQLGGNILLVGFSLEPSEMIVVKKIVGHYAKKISEKISYEEIKITLKQTEKAKLFIHEIAAKVNAGKSILAADTTNHNLYTALSEALEKVYSQAEHKERTARQEK